MTSTHNSPARTLEGRTAIVTGSTSGIGAAIAERLAAAGSRVLISGRDSTRGNQVVAEIGARGGVASFLASDLGGSYADLRRFASDAATALGGTVHIVTLTPGNEAFRDVLDQMTTSTPAVVVVQPGDIAAGVAFLASDDSSMIHGTTLYVDGGISATRLT